mgnify:CR=1 FL=1
MTAFPPMTEKQLSGAVTDLCHLLGVEVFHPLRSQGSRAGWPDEALWGPGGFMLRELKTEQGRISEEQHATLSSLGLAGVDVAVWRPRDLHSGRILRELRRVAAP